MAQLKGYPSPAIAAPLGALPLSARLLVRLAMTLTRQDERRRTRRALAKLDDYMLKDIGLSEKRRADELARPFWRQ